VKVKNESTRTCISCRKSRTKVELVRFVRTPDSKIILDPSGKISGRGAYICLDEDCFNEMKKRKRLAKELNVEIDNERVVELEEQFNELVKKKR